MTIYFKKGQRAIAGILFFFMASVIVALFLPTVKENIAIGSGHLGNVSNSVLIGIMLNYWPVFFVIMMLIIFVVVIKQ